MLVRGACPRKVALAAAERYYATVLGKRWRADRDFWIALRRLGVSRDEWRMTDSCRKQREFLDLVSLLGPP